MVSGVFFAVCHGVPVFFPYTVMLGLCLGYLGWFRSSPSSEHGGRWRCFVGFRKLAIIRNRLSVSSLAGTERNRYRDLVLPLSGRISRGKETTLLQSCL